MPEAHWSAILGSLATAAAVVTALGLALWQHYAPRKREAQRTRSQVRFYANTFLLKINKWLEHPEATSRFETDNRKNFDTVESLIASAHVLKENEYHELWEFIKYYKTAAQVRHDHPEDLEEYKKRAEALLEIFGGREDRGR